ncbi:transcriptional regulator [Paenibacillus thiaminolyticus]|uniref:transcriptional regulator n=1 Tax=Paenibacillus thiaminolyticus TaxID=49283 RepID=UPI0035A5FE35
MEEKKGTAATRAKNKYNTENYDRLYPYVPKGRKAVYEAAAKRAGLSLNDFITRAVEEKIEREGLERPSENIESQV